MSYFAQVQNGIVQQVISVEQKVIDEGYWGDPSEWIQTSYNTHNGVHYGPDGQPDGGIALRWNYAGIGYVYNPVYDVFYPPQPYPSWVLNTTNFQWEAPVPYPNDGKSYVWDEATLSWVLRGNP